MEEYIARRIKNAERTQDMRAHAEKVAFLTADCMAPLCLQNLGKLCGLVHDMGKFSPEFQAYIRLEEAKKGKINHSSAGAAYIYKKFYKPADNKWKRLTAQLICNAVCSHHSGLLDCIRPNYGGVPTNEFIRRMALDSDTRKVEQLFFENILGEAQIEDLFLKAAGEVMSFLQTSEGSITFRIGMLQKLLFSALVDSDRYDAYCFEAEKEPDCRQTPAWNAAAVQLEKRIAGFPQDSEINLLRSEISARCLAYSRREGGIYRLSVPTGGGKTLASLRFALNFAVQHTNIRHIYYVIPYTTIIDQTAQEIRNICGNKMVLEHHSSIVPDTSMDSDTENLADYELLTQRWTSPVILTTVVQFMNAIFSWRAACMRRMHALCNSVIILDEVQAMPKKMMNLFNEAANFLAYACGCTILLCTATQPVLEKTSHPIRLAPDCDIVPPSKEMARVFQRTQAVNLAETAMDCQNIGRLAAEQLQTQNSLLIICNTTRAAREIFDALDNTCTKIFLTTKLCRAHRKDRIEYIKTRTETCRNLGPAADPAEKLVVVSTQLVEAGVDFSFECVFRLLAGVDNLVQAAGRCNRNGEFAGCRNVFLIEYKDENLRRLPEIAYAKQLTKRILSYGKNIDLLSPETIKDYYTLYLQENDAEFSELDYILEKPVRTTIMDILSDNQRIANAYRLSGGQDLPIMRQAFQTAGEKFQVIDGGGQGILVPYGKGAEIIAELNSACGVEKKAQLIQESTPYTVNLFEWEIQRLAEKKAVYMIADTGILALTDGYYDETYGVVEEAKLEFIDF